MVKYSVSEDLKCFELFSSFHYVNHVLKPFFLFSGFEVVDRGCCGTGLVEVVILCNRYAHTCPDDTKYLFWDSYHPTEKGYKILVQRLLQSYTNSFL